MYGASFAQAFDAELVEQSDLSDDYGLLNYGIGGTGAGQALLLMRETLDRHREQDPIVVIGLVADSDFDRTVLRFRGRPKARVVVKDGLVASEGPVLPGGGDAYIDKYGVGITSYAWSYFLKSGKLLPVTWRDFLSGRTAMAKEKRELVPAIVLAMQDELEQRGMDYGFLLFSSRWSLPPAQISDRERAIVHILQRNGIPYVQAREHFIEAAAGDSKAMDSFFYQQGVHLNHPNGAGNQLILDALREGVLQRFQSSEASAGKHQTR